MHSQSKEQHLPYFQFPPTTTTTACLSEQVWASKTAKPPASMMPYTVWNGKKRRNLPLNCQPTDTRLKCSIIKIKMNSIVTI